MREGLGIGNYTAGGQRESQLDNETHLRRKYARAESAMENASRSRVICIFDFWGVWSSFEKIHNPSFDRLSSCCITCLTIFRLFVQTRFLACVPL